MNKNNRRSSSTSGHKRAGGAGKPRGGSSEQGSKRSEARVERDQRSGLSGARAAFGGGHSELNSAQTGQGRKGAARHASGGSGKRPANTALAGLPVEKNGEYTAEIIGIGHDGEGVGRVDGFTLFIPGALPGERVRVKVLKLKKQFGYAKLLEVQKASPDRVGPPCPIYDQCGGCQLQHLDYAAQLEVKRQLVVDNLERIGKLKVADRTGGVAGAADHYSGDYRMVKDAGQPADAGLGIPESQILNEDVLESAEVGKGMDTAGSAVSAINEADDSVGEGAYANNTGDADLYTGMAGSQGSLRSRELQPLQDTEFVDAASLLDSAGDGDAEILTQDGAGYEAAFAGTEGIVVYPTIGMDDPWRYRNKAQVPFGEEQGGLVGGFYAQGSHRIIDMEACLIQHSNNDEVIAKVKEIGRRLGIRAYREETHEGLLRHVVVKVGFRTGEIMVVLITNGEEIPRAAEWIREIRAAIPGVASICQNVNIGRTNVIFGRTTRVLWGHEVIYDYIGDVKFAISARSFFQVNPVQTEALYGKALEYAGLTGGETVVDAYCGIGTISLFLAKHAKKVYGVEIVPEAIEDAKRNALLNGISNAEFAVGGAEDVLPEWQRAGVRPDVIVVDPPRKGCDERLLDTILQLRPERVVYVSCNASTLARDLRVLEDGGYRTVSVQPVDMFPHTVHVENVALLVRCDTDV
ncbi:23S rRNA (uracil(1939)-C(5))-methyltransferase RlmD [Paenibacillus lutrae]|uniref:23S rRNA (Uracil(1939)-C(5))-methyltransferase RlmD n=1 Tax=Paenibacillus lutrae TaxID=2078573 RepID=A0A7X3FJL2_9BACL|nr:23S rRNA (uracil(1939)-C(5))-methyltransferase RlmD [Paenibacillus lutrae]MVP00961.1 23S rRNA (uracil(1939)-C(5))-methyltransferase RlmD [Paenibacillus lutrae]